MGTPWIIAYGVQWGFLVLLGVLVFVLYHELGRSYLGTAEATTRDGLRVGLRAPRFHAIDAQGSHVEFSPQSESYTMLIFGAIGCSFCEQLLPELDAFQHEYGDSFRTLLVFKIDEQRNYDSARYETRIPMWTVTGNAPMMRYKVRAVPFGFVIDQDGIIRAKGLVNGRDHLNYLYDTACPTVNADVAEPEPEETHA